MNLMFYTQKRTNRYKVDLNILFNSELYPLEPNSATFHATQHIQAVYKHRLSNGQETAQKWRVG